MAATTISVMLELDSKHFRSHVSALRYAVELADLIPDYYPEKKKLLRRLKRKAREMLLHYKVRSKGDGR